MKRPSLDEVFEQAKQLPLLQRTSLVQRLMAGIEHEVATGQAPVGTQNSPDKSPVAEDLKELTFRIIGCAMNVHREKGPGYRENTYQRDLETHLTAAGLECSPQKMISVYASAEGNRLIGFYVSDFVINNQVIVEIKARFGLDNSHIAQVIGYLAVSGCTVGLLVNFGERSLQWKRILPPKKIQEHVVNRQWLFVPDWLKEENS